MTGGPVGQSESGRHHELPGRDDRAGRRVGHAGTRDGRPGAEAEDVGQRIRRRTGAVVGHGDRSEVLQLAVGRQRISLDDFALGQISDKKHLLI